MLEQVEGANSIIELQDKHIAMLEARVKALEAQIAADSQVSQILRTSAKIPEIDADVYRLAAQLSEQCDDQLPYIEETIDAMERMDATFMEENAAIAKQLYEDSSPLHLSASLPANLFQVMEPKWTFSHEDVEESCDGESSDEYATSEDVELVCKKSDDLVKALKAVTGDCGTEVQRQWAALMRENGDYKDRIEKLEELVSRRAERLKSGDAELRLCRTIKGLCCGSQKQSQSVRRWRVG